MPDRRAKILVADVPEVIPLHREILCPRYDVEAVVDYHAACNRVGDDTDLVICGVHFDESRMVEFFSAVRHIPKTFVCFRGVETPLPPAALRVTKLACEVLGGAGFIDFVSMREKYGHDAAVDKALDCVERALVGKTVECE
ncbi:MAG: hypothetical protein ACM30I_06430 [Gemmatimonas sp.]